MRRILLSAFVLGLVLSPAARADDAIKAVIDKAIRAHGGAEKLTRDRAVQTKSKGTLELAGNSVSFTQETVAYQGKFKEEVKLEVMGQAVTVTSGFDGKAGWINANGTDVPVDEKLQKELQEASYQMKLGRFVFLKDKSVELSPLGETKLDGKTLVGIKVTSKGHRDTDLHFDKETGLLTKINRKALDAMSGQEVEDERIIKEYQQADGIKVAKKVLVNRDGKKFMEVEVEEVKIFDKVDDDTFAKP